MLSTGVNRFFDSGSLKERLFEWGAVLAGFADVRVGLAKELAHLPSAIALAVLHPKELEKPPGAESLFYNHNYQEVDALLQGIQLKTVAYLRQKGWLALNIPPDSARESNRFIARLYPLFPHKTAATCAGLGWIGKSGLLVTEKYGPCLSWATVLTNAPLHVSPKPITRGRCGSCRCCVDACPVGAIRDVNWVRSDTNGYSIDVEACRRQIESNSAKYGVPSCGRCVEVCRLSRHREF